MPLQRPTIRVCHALLWIPTQSGPACSAEVSHTKWPLLHHVVQAVHKEYHKDGSHGQVTKTGAISTQPSMTQPIAYLISKQVVPYQTRGGTCCPGGSSPNIRSLVDPSMTSHITWRNPTVSTIPTLLKPQHRISLGSIHISTDGRPSLTKTQAKLNITKDGETCMTLMTAWLSITTQYNPNPKVWGLGTILNHAGQCVYQREREYIGSIWSRVTCLDSLLAPQSLAHRALRDSRSLRLLTVVIRNKQHKKINKQYIKQYLMTNQTVLKDATHCYERVSTRIA
jgi:hypothetical protein